MQLVRVRMFTLKNLEKTSAVVVFAPVKSQETNGNNLACPQGAEPYAGGASYTCRNVGDFCAIGFTCQPATPGSTTVCPYLPLSLKSTEFFTLICIYMHLTPGGVFL
jgi:hypothetical protein